MSIGSRIGYLCRADGITQKQLAKEVGVAESVISRYVNDERAPKLMTMYKIAKVFGVDMEFFLLDEEI